MQKIGVTLAGFGYRRILRPVFFLFDSEPIHDFFLAFGALLSSIPGIPLLAKSFFGVTGESLRTSVGGVSLANPIGLAAGFDHEARLPGILGGLGFGFGSVGTVTNGFYGGNPYPRLKRLPRSRSLLVNKGFKSSGVDHVLKKLPGVTMSAPIGISLGRTNTPDITSHESAIADIVTAFQKVMASQTPFAYYELNISCPNLLTKVEFYDSPALDKLLTAVTAIGLDKPLFLKMPIMLSNDETTALLDTIRLHPVAAVIFGNLQKDRSNPAFDKEELAMFDKYQGNWSGMPCKDRSDELIALAYQHTGGKLPVIGCGGVFSAEDAFRKITLGASAIQLATALVYEGPFVPAEIALGLKEILATKGFARVSDAVGSAQQ